MSTKNDIESDINFILGLWKQYSIIGETNTTTLCDTFNVDVDVLDECCMEITDKSNNVVYNYEMGCEEFINEDGWYIEVPEHISKFLSAYQSSIDALYSSIESECDKLGYSVDYDDGLMYAYSDEWVIVMPYWCTDRSLVDADYDHFP